MKEAYALEFAATIERAEKQIILAKHGRRLLELLDDTPVVPGDNRIPFDANLQARQILDDAEDDLKDWRPDAELGSSMQGGTPPLQEQTKGKEPASLPADDLRTDDGIEPTPKSAEAAV